MYMCHTVCSDSVQRTSLLCFFLFVCFCKQILLKSFFSTSLRCFVVVVAVQTDIAEKAS